MIKTNTLAREFSLLKAVMIAILVIQAIIYFSLPLIQDQNDSAAYYMNVYHKITGQYILEDRYPSFTEPNPIYPFYGYSVVLYVAKITGELIHQNWAIVVKCLHFIFYSLTCLLLLKITFRVSKSVGLRYLIAFIYLFYYPHLKFANLLMSETYCIFMLALCVYLFCKYLDEKKSRDAVMLYILGGHIILIKPVFILIILLFAIIHWILVFKKRLSVPSSSAILLLLLFPAFQVLYSTTYFNNQNIRPGLGRNLWNRVIAHDKLIPKDSYALNTLKEIFAEQEKEMPMGPWWDIVAGMSESDIGERESNYLLKDVAIDGILEHPGKYLFYTFRNSYDNYNFGSVNGWMYCNPPEFKNAIEKFNYDKNHTPLVDELLKQSFAEVDSKYLLQRINCSIGAFCSKTYFLFHNMVFIMLFIISGMFFVYQLFKSGFSNYYIMLFTLWWCGFSIVFGSNLTEYPQSRLILPAVMYVVMAVVLFVGYGKKRKTEKQRKRRTTEI